MGSLNYLTPHYDDYVMSQPDAPPKPIVKDVVRFDRVGLRYGRGPEVLSDIDLTLSAGSFNFLRQIGVVWQDFSLIDHLSVYANVALPLRVQGKAASTYDRNVRELLDWVGLGERMDASPRTLSGGEKQRVAIARAVIAKPKLLIADEPTGNVDTEIGARLIRLFGEMNRLGTTILIATHDRNLIDEVPARVLHLQEAKLYEEVGA